MSVSRTCGGFSYLKKLFDFNSQKERQLLMKCNIKLVEPTNNRAKAAIETICHYEKDNFRQPFRFGGFKPGSDDEYYSDRHLEWYRTIKYFTGFISKAFNFIYGIAKDKVTMN